MKKLFEEFKTFINRGSVMDLAVGMIIGSAFTAIINSLVNSILKPLINWIPGAGETGALQTVLREAVTDADGNVVTEALILDWGAVISAIITFLCTAAVLFLIVKAFNKVKDAGGKIKEEIKTAVRKEAASDVEAITEKVAFTAAKADSTAVTPAQKTEPVENRTEKLLEEILELLKARRADKE